MEESEPSISNWRSLYKAAVEFKATGCWDWMLDTDIFGVQNPANGEIGYCCVMGNLGEHFALATYMGTEGLNTYLKIRDREFAQVDIEAFMSQKCLMASFEDRAALSELDRKTIKTLGLKFRGRNQWPLFRNYQPGYFPWYLTKNAAEYLTLALQQTIEVSLRFEDDPSILASRKKNHYLVRVPKRTNGGWQWVDEWLKPKPLGEPKIVIPPLNEIRLQRIKRAIKRRGGTWEADFFFSPTPVREKRERPYYPYALLFVDSHSGLILNVGMARPTEHMTEFRNDLMGLIENTGMKPSEILVRREEALELLDIIASRLGIKLRLVEKLGMLEYAQASMFQFLR